MVDLMNAWRAAFIEERAARRAASAQPGTKYLHSIQRKIS